MFTHLVSDAGLFNYSPSACHQRAASCSKSNPATAYPPQGSWKQPCFTSLLLLSSFPCQRAKESPQSSYVGDTKTVSHFSLPEQREPTAWCTEQQTQDGASLQATKIPGARWPAVASFFLLLLPLSLPPLSIPSFSSAFLFFSSFLCCRQPQTQQELGPTRLLLFFFFSPAAGFGCNPCELDHQRHTTHSQ